MKKLRLVELKIEPTFVMDDGENLSPVQAGQFTVPAAELDSFPDKLREQIARREQELNDQPDE